MTGLDREARARWRTGRTATAALLAGMVVSSGCGLSGDPLATGSGDDGGGPRVVTLSTPPVTDGDPLLAFDDDGDVGDGGTGSPEPDPALARMSGAPPLVAVAGVSSSGISASPTRGAATAATPQLPLAYLDEPSAEARIEQQPDVESAVSPDGRYVAIEQPADALNDDGVEIVATGTGEVVESLTYSTAEASRGLSDVVWSSDSRAIHFTNGSEAWVHRIGGTTVAVGSSYDGWALTGDANATEYLRCGRYDPTRVTVAAEATTTPGFSCDAVATSRDTAGEAVVVYSAGAGIYRMVPGGEPVLVHEVADLPEHRTVDLASCGEIVVVNPITGGDQVPVLLHTPTGGSAAVGSWSGQNCPVASPDGSLAAYTTGSGSVEVVALETGAVTEVARSGVPLAFGRSGTKLLVEGNGTFIVNADGSGGSEASAQIDNGGYSSKVFCAAATSGLGLLLTSSGVSLFDIDADEATATDADELPQTCATTPDHHWLVAGDLLVDLDLRRSARLGSVDATSGERSGAGGGLGLYLWHGPQITSPGVAVS